MNERIRLLAEQAGMRTVTYEYDEDTYFTDSLDPQKFAELIVRECLDKISGLVIPEEAIRPIGSYEKWNQALGHAALEIEQHFYGVEE